MKFITPIQVCKGFTLCRGHMTSGEKWEYKGFDSLKDYNNQKGFECTQLFYLLEGDGVFYYNDEEVASFNTETNSLENISSNHIQKYNKVVNKLDNSYLFDLRYFVDKPACLIAGKNGATWVCINPLPYDHFFETELFNGYKTIEGDGNEHIVFILKGEANIMSDGNNVNLQQFRYSRILKGKTAHIVVPPGSQAIYMTREKLINI